MRIIFCHSCWTAGRTCSSRTGRPPPKAEHAPPRITTCNRSSLSLPSFHRSRTGLLPLLCDSIIDPTTHFYKRLSPSIRRDTIVIDVARGSVGYGPSQTTGRARAGDPRGARPPTESDRARRGQATRFAPWNSPRPLASVSRSDELRRQPGGIIGTLTEPSCQRDPSPIYS
jgi:hypothetical protein